MVLKQTLSHYIVDTTLCSYTAMHLSVLSCCLVYVLLECLYKIHVVLVRVSKNNNEDSHNWSDSQIESIME